MGKIILGIDPGTLIMGIAVLKNNKNKLESLLFESLDLRKETDYIVKLKKIFDRIIEVIDKFHPDEIAIESPFLGKNAQSMLKLGRAQGVAISAGLSRGIPINEYAPKKIKLAVTGSGNASKEQVLGMVKNILNLKELPKEYDASDAMAVAICHNINGGRKSIGKGYSNWSSFVNKNKERVL